jgi:glycosyltransferase involved in cell wall biosynthesis
MARRTLIQIRRYELELFVNAKYKSELPGCGRRNIYYCHFPHRLYRDGTGIARRLYLRAARLLEFAIVVRRHGGFTATYDEVWANSEFTRRHVESRWGRAATVLYPPCDEIEPREKERVIATVGRFQRPADHVPYKAQDVLVRVFRNLTDLHAQGWRFVLAGAVTEADQAFLSELRSDARGLPIDFVINGSRDDVRALLGKAAIYWHAQGYGLDPERYPETQEHFGISTVEAMSAAAIPVVYDAGGPAEIVAGLGADCTWATPEELAVLARRWANAPVPEARSVRQECRERASDFGPARFADRLQELL